MKHRSITIISVVVLALVVALSGFLATRHPARSASAVDSPLLGRTAPAFTASTLEGHPLSLASYRGDVVVLTFWSSWCNPCLQEAPELTTFSWQNRLRPVRVVGVVFNDSVASASTFENRYGSLYPSVVDGDGQIANNYGVTQPPTTFIINPNGVVAATLVGATSAAQLASVVHRVLQ
jgi:cytochrome c biogenesis protein CcmG/thiol:disulfide interchange protein DsbE